MSSWGLKPVKAPELKGPNVPVPLVLERAGKEDTEAKSKDILSEDEILRLKEIAKDRLGKMFPSLIRIRNKDGKVVPFYPTEIHKRFKSIQRRKTLVLKGRQVWQTSFCLGDNFLDCIFQEGHRCLFMNLSEKTTLDVFERTHFYLDNFPLKPLLPKVTNSRTDSLSFDNGSKILAVTVKNDASEEEAKQFGRSGTFQVAHGTEVTYWKHYHIILDGLLASIPMNGKIVLESTGNGAQGGFYDDFKSIVNNGDQVLPNAWVLGDQAAYFGPWFLHPEYWIESDDLVTSKWRYQLKSQMEDCVRAHEAEMDKDSFISDDRKEGLKKFIRWQLVNSFKFLDDPERAISKFNQEYPATIEMAFQSSSFGFFPATLLRTRREEAKEENLRRRLPLLAGISSEGVLQFGQDVKIWVPPSAEPGINEYCIGVDSAGGHASGDFDAAWVKSRRLNMYVACIHGHYGPELFSPMVLGLAKYYHNAKICIEANNIGVALQMYLHNSKYHNLYRGKPDLLDYRGIGIVTTGSNRNRMLQALFLRFCDGLSIPYLEFYTEAAAFGKSKNKAKNTSKDEAQGGNHDDLIMAAAITELCCASMGKWSESTRIDEGAQLSLSNFGVLGRNKGVNKLSNGY